MKSEFFWEPGHKESIIMATSKSILKLYGFPFSQPCRSVLMLCMENGIDHQIIPVDARKGETRKPEFKKIHPAGVVPAIDDNGFLLGEAGAILQYLCEKNQLHSWYPKDLQQRARVNFWLHWNHSNTRNSTKQILVKRIWPPKDGSMEAALDAGRKELGRSVAFLEQSLATSGGPYLSSKENPTIADLMIAPELDQQLPEAFGLFDFKPYPNVSQWLYRLQTDIPSYKPTFKAVVDEATKFKEKHGLK